SDAAAVEAESAMVPPAHPLTAAAASATTASPPATNAAAKTVITALDINSFQEMLKESLTMDITS
ncbi:MAG TPA: hypothetical protein VFQ47_07460, partial [Nitrososphaera sp.]|nr:hypothetical protein [Nitrososphaera sp.]